MVEIGDIPILVHIMEHYSRYGYKEFLIALGYRGDIIKDYFLNFHPASDVSVDLATGEAEYHGSHGRDWRIRMIDTGLETMTGGRLLRLKRWLESDEAFMMTYGDGVSSIDITALVRFHQAHGRVATLTAVRPPARFGTMEFDGDAVVQFKEKPQVSAGWVNGGFFVFQRDVFEYLDSDSTVLEGSPLERLALDGQLMAYRHEGFWKCMDTLRDKQQLNDMWESGNVPWCL